MKRIITIVLIFSNLFAFAQIGGTYTYAFLNLPNSPKAASLGGTNVSIHEPTLIFNNPALLDSNSTNYLNFSFVNYFASVKWGFCSYSFQTPKFGSFAVGMQYINYGKFIAADEIGNITGEFSAADYTLTAVWSYKIDTLFTIGATIKPIFSVYETYSSVGLATDYGIVYNSQNHDFTAGFVFRNLGFQIKPYIEHQKEPLPFNIQLGISERLAHSPFRLSLLADHLNVFDLSFQKSEILDPVLNKTIKKPSRIETLADLSLRHLVFGVEIMPSKSFYISFGYNYQRRQELKVTSRKGLVGFSAGLGLTIKRFNFNYSISNYSLAGSAQFFSISLNINHLTKF